MSSSALRLTRTPVSGGADIAAIEAQGYERFMPFQSLGDALEHVAEVYPTRPALTYLPSAEVDVPPEVLSYGALMERLRQTANLLNALGVDDHHAVAFLLPPVPAAYLALLGGAMAGRVCPINFLLSTDHVAGLLVAASAKVLLIQRATEELQLAVDVERLKQLCPSLQHVVWVGDQAGDFGDLVAQQPGDALTFSRSVGADTVAAYFHTGGTTGAPKLALHTHGNQLHAAWSAAQFYATTEEDAIINGFPLFHVAGAFVFGLSTLLSGGNVVLPTALGMRNAAFVKRYWQFVERHQVTLLAAVPTVLSTLLSVEVGGSNISTVRALLTGGSPLPDELAAAFQQRLGIRVRNILGMTECAGVVSVEPFLAERTPGSCGLRLPFTTVCAIEDAVDDAEQLPPGATGILALCGPNVGPGYLDVASDGGTFLKGGWLATGDIGRVDVDERIYITGRAKDVIIRSSHNIDPRTIEDALMLDDRVLFAAAVGEPDEYAGEVPVAFVVLKPSEEVEPEALLALARPHISERPAWPKRLTLLDALPTTAVGKVYRPALRARATEMAFRERLHERGLSAQVEVRAVESKKAIELRFKVGRGGAVTCAKQIEEMMVPFAIAFQIEGPQALASVR